jgi:hypothetical protein
MYPYHNHIKKRILTGQLQTYYWTWQYPRIGKALVLVFDREPFFRPIRPERIQEYLPLLTLAKAGGEEKDVLLRKLESGTEDKFPLP